MLAALLGFDTAFDSYSLADTLPNKLTELLLSGVLTAVAVPVLVRARQEDADGGVEYTQRLMTMAFVWMGVATVAATAAAPLLTDLYVDSSTGNADPALVTAFGYLLLPEIFFYAMTALIAAILNAKSIFKPTAWAPVWNNVIVIVTGLVFVIEPGEITLNPVRMSDPKLLTLGIGTTLGIVAQVLAMLPALHRSGFRFRWRWGVDPRLKEFGELALWVLGYVAATQVGILVIDRVATSAAPGTVSIYNTTWLLVQLPYGVIGFALLTAILPRMSKNAGEGNLGALIDDMSFGNRMSTVMLGPISGLMTILGPQIGVALFSLGQSDSEATRLGLTLTASAFGLLPFTITLVQTRVFYAMKDARTPTLMMVVMVAVRIPLAYLTPVVLPPGQVVYGLAFANSISFAAGAIVGQFWLRRVLGNLRTGPVLATIGKTVVASAWGAAATLLVIKVLHALFSGAGRVALAWPTLVVGTLVGGAVTFGTMALLRVPELKPALDRVLRAVKRR
jgi:putative peptidoglycan lipid II flippase